AALAVGFPDASYKALPCRPTIACTADLVPPGVVELEVGYLYRRLGSGADQQSLPFLLKLTLAEWLQLQVGSNGATFASQPAPARFFDDVTVGLKLHLGDQDARTPSLSLSATASLPTPAARGYVRSYDAFFIAYVTKDLGWLHADLNLGLNAWQLDTAPRAQPWAALALSTALPRGFGPMVELYYFADAAPIDPADGGLLVALSYQPRNWLVLDGGADVGLVRSTRAVSAFVGLTIIPMDAWDTGAERRARAARQTRHER
ncbi:MAG TPA: hypothetical protein VF945_11505, partial [Polyangia bacterium]